MLVYIGIHQGTGATSPGCRGYQPFLLNDPIIIMITMTALCGDWVLKTTGRKDAKRSASVMRVQRERYKWKEGKLMFVGGAAVWSWKSCGRAQSMISEVALAMFTHLPASPRTPTPYFCGLSLFLAAALPRRLRNVGIPLSFREREREKRWSKTEGARKEVQGRSVCSPMFSSLVLWKVETLSW